MKTLDDIGWKTLKCRDYKHNFIEYDKEFSLWLVNTYHKDEYEKVKDDKFALGELRDKYYKKFKDKMNSLKVDCYKDYIKGNFTIELKAKLEDYDFNKEEYGIKYSKMKENVNGSKLIKSISWFGLPTKFKINKKDAKELHNKIKNKDILIKYNFHYIVRIGYGGRDTLSGPWVDLNLFLRKPFEIINPEDNSLIMEVKDIKK